MVLIAIFRKIGQHFLLLTCAPFVYSVPEHIFPEAAAVAKQPMLKFVTIERDMPEKRSADVRNEEVLAHSGRNRG